MELNLPNINTLAPGVTQREKDLQDTLYWLLDAVINHRYAIEGNLVSALNILTKNDHQAEKLTEAFSIASRMQDVELYDQGDTRDVFQDLANLLDDFAPAIEEDEAA